MQPKLSSSTLSFMLQAYCCHDKSVKFMLCLLNTSHISLSNSTGTSNKSTQASYWSCLFFVRYLIIYLFIYFIIISYFFLHSFLFVLPSDQVLCDGEHNHLIAYLFYFILSTYNLHFQQLWASAKWVNKANRHTRNKYSTEQMCRQGEKMDWSYEKKRID
jgi:hypothetical protein